MAAETTIDGIEREVGADIDLAIIWLHGLGADAGDFLPLIGELVLPVGVRFVFPNAPLRPVTINGGMRMRAWYDIGGFGPEAPEDEAGLGASAAIVSSLIERERRRGLPADRIVLAGFSQGGAVVLHAGLGGEHRPAGILGLSTYLPAAHRLSAGKMVAGVPVRLMHGTHDPVIPLEMAERSARWLRAQGVGVELSTYPMGHEVTRPVIADINAWLAVVAAR